MAWERLRSAVGGTASHLVCTVVFTLVQGWALVSLVAGAGSGGCRSPWWRPPRWSPSRTGGVICSSSYATPVHLGSRRILSRKAAS
ncbi:hypothetical protein G443_001514 [Actinoalloteichus cyanogriseus DSM 43889]|uniref:Uncharacterized protein n=1 Tax=Actinoalloteichus caeruleus DSM 43889 TaxID=1120930 RepID=A0ABT1JGC7_ACTCY|nr:hypothetical protein [Actinoalloteichus caeruleus DSM 43889]